MPNLPRDDPLKDKARQAREMLPSRGIHPEKQVEGSIASHAPQHRTTGSDSLSAADIGAAPTIHDHGLLKHSLNATVAPTVNDDSSEGYEIGSVWINTASDTVWQCTDATEGAAVWKDLSTQGAGGGDADAIHDNVAGEIAAIAEKVTPVNADLMVIEDSAAANAKKRVQVGNLPGGTHAAVTLALDAQELLNLAAQELGFVTKSANLFLAGPASGPAADPTFRAIADADIPATIARDSELHAAVTLAGTPNYITLAGQVITRALINLASHVTGLLPIGNGGTGQATQQAAIDALTDVAAATNEHVLTKDTATGNAKFKAATGGGGTDADAIHDNVAGEIAAIAEKVTPVNADLLVIEDSAAANAKKRVQVGNLPGGGGASGIAQDPIWDARGDLVYGIGDDAGARLAGNTSNTRKFLREVAIGGLPQNPAWDTIQDGDIPATIARDSELHAQLHAALHAEGAADDLVAQNLAALRFKLGNQVLLKSILSVFGIRNAADTGDATFSALQAALSAAATAPTHVIRKQEHDLETTTGHHAKYTDAEAVAAVPYEFYIAFGTDPVNGQVFAA